MVTIVNLFANLCPQIAAGPSILKENSDYPNSFCMKKWNNVGDEFGVYEFRVGISGQTSDGEVFYGRYPAHQSDNQYDLSSTSSLYILNYQHVL